MGRGDRTCPNCGSPVTPFAAGWAICGTDLEAWRRTRTQTRIGAVQLPRPAVPTITSQNGRDAAFVAILILLAVVSPLFGILFAVLGARDRHVHGRMTARNVII